MSRRLRILTAVGATVLLGFGLWEFIPKRPTSAALSRCEYNLRVLEICKSNWQSANRKSATDTPSWDDLKEDLLPYAQRYDWTNGIPVCPDGGVYTLGKVREKPKCSIDGRGHSLP